MSIKRKIGKVAFVTHKWLGLIIGIQVLLWIAGGFFFAMLPFQSVIKGHAYVHKLDNQFEQQTLYPLSDITTQINNIRALTTLNINHQPVYKITDINDQHYLFNARTGERLQAPSEQDIRQHAKALYKGDGNIISIRLIDQPLPRQLFIVDELYGKTHMWQVKFDDIWSNRLYFDGNTGEYYNIRNNAWVLYDFFWRLHLMDYWEGESFNHWLIRIAVVLAILLAISGIVMLFYARFIIKKRPR